VSQTDQQEQTEQTEAEQTEAEQTQSAPQEPAAAQQGPAEDAPRGDARDPAHVEVDADDPDGSPGAGAAAASAAGEQAVDAEPGSSAQVDDPADGATGERYTPDQAEAGVEELVPEDPDTPLVIRRAPRVRTVDFSQPTKFTVELRRRIVRVLGPFCEAFAIRLSSELRAPVELAVADSSQLTWSAAKAQLQPTRSRSRSKSSRSSATCCWRSSPS
jgi:hypothetical protein